VSFTAFSRVRAFPYAARTGPSPPARRRQVDAERRRLFDSFEQTVFHIQQKAGFHSLVLEKKLEALNDVVEKKARLPHPSLIASRRRGGESNNEKRESNRKGSAHCA